MAAPDDPFAELGLAPSLDLACIKRAYFAAVARHPPHQDAEAFRRTREAYEKLLRPSELALAYLIAELSPDEERDCLAWHAQLVAEARSTAVSVQLAREKIDRFVALAESSSLQKMIELCRPKV